MRITRALCLVALTPFATQHAALTQSLAKTSEVLTPIAATSPTKVPMLVRYSSVAKHSDGSLLGGKTSMTLLIYKEAQGGDPLWVETQSVTADTEGRYELYLGSTYSSGLPADLFGSGEARWLEVQIAGQLPEPRVLLTSVPYALKAADAATLGGLPASAFMLAGSSARSSIAPAVVAPLVTSTSVTTSGGTKGTIPMFTTSNDIENSTLYYNSTGFGIGRFPAGMLDVNGNAIIRGSLDLSRAGDATTSTAYPSKPFFFQSSVYNTTNKTALLPYFQVQSEPTGNNTASTGATMNFLYYSGVGGAGPQETGLYFNPNGTIHFAPAQTFPGGPGAGTISGVTAGADLTGGGTTGVVTLNLDSTKVPLLAKSNTFVGNQAITGNAVVSGEIGIGTTSPEGLLDVEGNAGQLILVNATGPGDWAINSFGGGNGGLAGRFVAGPGSGGNAGGSGIAAGGGSTNDSGIGGTGAIISGGYSYTGTGGDGVDATAGNYAYGTREGYAGNFTGDVRVSGTLFAGAKNFRIDHPLDPANKYLDHTSTESSEMMNIYSGNVTTDGSGLSTVALPEWFEAVNTDFRYQLTVVGQFAQAIIKNKIAGGQFTIMTNVPNVEVSWMITAIRQDAYAKAHPMVVEQPKPANERGFYIHPELYGQPQEKQTEWGRHQQQMQQMKQMNNSRKTGVDVGRAEQPQ